MRTNTEKIETAEKKPFELTVEVWDFHGSSFRVSYGKIEYRNRVSPSFPRYNNRQDRGDAIELILPDDVYRQLMESLAVAGMYDLLKPMPEKPLYTDADEHRMFYRNINGSEYEYLSPLAAGPEFKGIVYLLMQYACLPPHLCAHLEAALQGRRNDYCETICCNAIVRKDRSYCPSCGKCLGADDVRCTDKAPDLDGTMRGCKACNNWMSSDYLYCDKCGALL